MRGATEKNLKLKDRDPLKWNGLRRTGIKPSTKPMKRSRLKPVSAKKRNEIRETSAPRVAYVWGKTCAVLPKRASVEVHEIVGGAMRHVTVRDPAFWLAVCREGHDIAQYEKKARQLARKFLQAPETVDLDRFNEVYQGPESPVTWADIAAHLQMTEP